MKFLDGSEYKSKSGSVFYVKVLDCFVVKGEPVCESLNDKVELFNEFINWAKLKNIKVCGYYISKEFSSCEIDKLYCGNSHILSPAQFVKSKEYRRYRALRENRKYQDSFVFTEINLYSKSTVKSKKLKLKLFEGSILETKIRSELNDVYSLWRRKKNRLFSLSFLIQPFLKREFYPGERLWVAKKSKKIHGFVSVVPYADSTKYYLNELVKKPTNRHTITPVKNCLNILICKMMKDLEQEGVKEVSFGISPFVEGNIIQSRSSDHIKNNFYNYIFWAISKLKWPYSFRGNYFFKSKWKSGKVLPRYMWKTKSLSWPKAIFILIWASFRFDYLSNKKF